MTRATIFVRNQVVANFDGELIIKMLPNAAKNDPINTGIRLVLIKTLNQTPAIRKIAPIDDYK